MMSGKSVKKRLGSKEIEDRLSQLPDAIILHILSFVDAKDAVRSSILSKRFAYLWTNVSSLHFEDTNVKFIHTTFLFHKMFNLEKLSIVNCFTDDKDFNTDIELGRVIRVLGLSSVKEFTLEMDDFNGFLLPQYFYSFSSFTKLTLKSCSIETSGFVNWNSLQILCLAYIDISDKTISDIISGCPTLELLEMSHCAAFTQIDLTNNKCLRKLVIDHYDDYECETIEISAPNLQSLVLSADMEWFKCRVLNAGSLTDCCLNFRLRFCEVINTVTSLLDDLSHIKVVTIGVWVLRVLSELELNGLPHPVSSSIKCLKLYSSLRSVDQAGIACLLRGLNGLEKLFIDTRECFNYLVRQEDKRYWTFENMKTGFDLKLKTIEICGLVANGILLDDQNEGLLLLEFLMKTASFLENVTISAYGSSRELLDLTKKLLSFPRSSPHAVIKIIELD